MKINMVVDIEHSDDLKKCLDYMEIFLQQTTNFVEQIVVTFVRGGVGKTSMARTYALNNKYQNVARISGESIDTTKNSLFELDHNISITEENCRKETDNKNIIMACCPRIFYLNMCMGGSESSKAIKEDIIFGEGQQNMDDLVRRDAKSLKTMLNTMEEFDSLENEIQWNGDERQKLARSLDHKMSETPSPTLASHVQKGLAILLAPALASQFCWKGLGRKSFRWTHIQRVFFVAVQVRFPAATDYEIEKPVRKWLKRVALMHQEKMTPRTSGPSKKMGKKNMGRTAPKTTASSSSRLEQMHSIQRVFRQRHCGRLNCRKMAKTFGAGKSSGKYPTIRSMKNVIF